MNQDEGEPVPSDSQPESDPDGRGMTRTMENEGCGVEEVRERGDNDNVKNEGGEGEEGDGGRKGGHAEGEGGEGEEGDGGREGGDKEEEGEEGEGDGGREGGDKEGEGEEGEGDGGREGGDKEGERGQEGGKEEGGGGGGGGGISSVEEEETDSEKSAQLTVDAEDDKEIEKKQEEVEEGKVNRTLDKDSKEIEEEGEGGEEDSPRDKEKKAPKDQLLESATGSSESDITGAPLRTSEYTAQDRNLEQFSEILLDSDLSPTDSETGLSLPGGGAGAEGEGPAVEEGGRSKPERRVRFADEVMETTDNADSKPRSSPRPETLPTGPQATVVSPRSSGNIVTPLSPRLQSPRSPSAPHTHEEIIAGVSYSAEYMGSTPIILTGIASAKTARMHQAQQVVKLFKHPENDVLPRFPVTIRISSQSIKIVDSTAGIDLMDHPLYTISYVADIENVLVIMINRILPPAAREGSVQEEEKRENEKGGGGEMGEGRDGGERMGNGGGEGGEGVKSEEGEGGEVGGESGKGEVGESEGGGEGDGEFNGLNIGPIPRMTCHVLETNDARHVAMVIGQAFSVAYKEFLRATGISEEALEQAEYAHILNAQTAPQAELDMLRDREKIRQLNLAKHKGDILGLMVVESGYGSALPTPVIAHLSKTGSAARSGQLNVGDHIIAINGVNMVGMPVKVCIEQLKKCRYQNLVKMTVVSCPTVVDITIVRPDLKFQLGFTIQDGVVRSLTRGSIAERSGVRVGHYIIEINGTSTVGLSHKDLVHLLTTTVGDLHLKTMPHLMYKLITGQVIPIYH